MEKHEWAFPWVPEYEDDFRHYRERDDSGLMESGLSAIANLAYSSLELYLFFFFTYIITGLLISQ